MNKLIEPSVRWLPIEFQGAKKTQVAEKVQSFAEHVEQTGSYLQAAETLSALELFVKDSKAQLRHQTMQEATKWKGGYNSPSGSKIEAAKAGGGKWNFEVCNDPVYNDLSQQLDERIVFLKSVPAAGMDIIVDGVGVHIHAAKKPESGETVKVTLAK